ncbi:hypothetical protein L873DRAFT_1703688, partial [Choiromyces venosus 120613-1]
FYPLPEEDFCILLYQLFYPHHLKDYSQIFGCSRTQLLVVLNDIIIYLVKQYKQTLK